LAAPMTRKLGKVMIAAFELEASARKIDSPVDKNMGEQNNWHRFSQSWPLVSLSMKDRAWNAPWPPLLPTELWCAWRIPLLSRTG
jgi:hypothetical protein